MKNNIGFKNSTSLVAILACVGIFSLTPTSARAQSQSGTDLKNCHIIETGDMVCDGSTGTVGEGTPLGTISNGPGGKNDETPKGPTVSGSIIISNPNSCDGIQTISLGASKVTAENGVAKMTFDSNPPYKVGDHITVTGANDGSVNGSYVVTETSGKNVSFKLPDTSKAAGTIDGSVFVTGDVADKAETDIEACQTTDTSTTEQKDEAIKKLQEQITQLNQLLDQLKAQMENQTLQQQQDAAQQLQQAQSTGGMTGLMGMLQQLLGMKPSNPLSQLTGLNGTQTPSVPTNTTSSPTLTQAQQNAETTAQKDNGTDFNREPKADGALCDQNKDDALGSRPLETAVNQEITHRYGAGSKKMEMDAKQQITGMTAVFDAGEGKTGAYHAKIDLGTSELILDDQPGVASAIGVAKSINSALSKVPPSKLDHCFTTVVASAAYAHPDLAQKLKSAIELANLGKFKEAGEAAKAAVGGGKLGEDMKLAFESLGGPVTMPAAINSPKSPQEAIDQAKAAADKAAAEKAAAEKAAQIPMDPEIQKAIDKAAAEKAAAEKAAAELCTNNGNAPGCKT